MTPFDPFLLIYDPRNPRSLNYNSSHFKNLHSSAPSSNSFSKSQDIAEIIIINQLCCFFRSISIPFYLHSISIWSTIDLDRIPPPETLHSANRVFRPRYRNGMYLSCTTAWRRTNATDNKRRSVDWGKRADGTVPRLRHRWISNFCPVWKPVAR